MKLSRNRRLAIVIALVVAADWITKFLIRNEIPRGGRLTLLDGWITLQHNWNPGIAWGWFRELPGMVRMPNG